MEFVIEHVQREERPELPEEALREAVANAVAHRDYRSTANVHVYVFKDRVEVLGPGGLPEGMTEADLGSKSIPRNPLLFGMLYRMGVVENIGSGIRRIREICREHGVAQPAIDVSEHWVTVNFPRPDSRVEYVRSDHANAVREERKDAFGGTPEVRPESRPESKLKPRPKSDPGPESESVETRVLALLRHAPMSRSALSNTLGYRSVSGGLRKAIHSLMAAELIEYTLPEKPNSRLQAYRLTERGRNRLEQPEDGSR